MTAWGPSRGVSSRPAELDDRSRRVLGLLVRQYIEHGEPVSSLWLANHAGLGVSSATLRNILSHLEADGYVHQPHTSAGRVPTDQGYRTYVDQLVQTRRPTRPTADVEARLRQAGSVDVLLASVSQEVSRASHQLGFVAAAATDSVALKHIEFVALDDRRILVVLVASDGQVWHKAIAPEETLAPSDLVQAANYLNATFVGRRLDDIREDILASLREDRILYDRLRARALALASQTLDEVDPGPQLFVHGASSLVEGLREAEMSIATLRAVLAMIEEKHRLVRLLAEYVEGPGLTVVIGAEHTIPEFRDCSVVLATHGEGGDAAVVGVIGPRRMRYSRAITAVESLSQATRRVLGDNRN